jgi:putative ABC transport system permease protein
VNRAFADRFLEGPALGREIKLGGRVVTVIGVARNGHYDLRDVENGDVPLVYFAWSQTPTPFVTIHARTAGDPMPLSDAIRSAVRSVEPSVPLQDPQTLQRYTSVAFAAADSGLQVLVFLSLSAIVLASVGLFAVISYTISLRTKELGIRMALGASPLSVGVLVLRSALQIMAIGGTAGATLSGLLAPLLRSKVGGLPPLTVMDVAVPVAILAASAMVAAILPARRAAVVDPARTLYAD